MRAEAASEPVAMAAIIVAAVLALLSASCGSSTSPASSGGSPDAGGSAASSASAVAYSSCMRSHGVLNFPDPASNGQVPKVDTQMNGCEATIPGGAPVPLIRPGGPG